MVDKETVTRAEPVKIEHTSRRVEALEWKAVTSGPTIVVAVEGDVAELVGPVAEKLMDRNRVIGLNLKSAWDPITVAWWAADPVVLLAQGGAGKTACATARLSPGAIKAVVLADYSPEPGENDHSRVRPPVLVFHGRDSSSGTHEKAVKVHGEIPGSRLVEPEGCGELPTKNCATALAESVAWFLDELGKPFMEFGEFSGSDREPVDPKG